MQSFVNWLRLVESVTLFPDADDNPRDGQSRKFVIGPDGNVVMGAPGYNHSQLLSAVDGNPNQCVLGDINRFGIVLRDNGTNPTPTSVNSGIAKLAKAGYLTSRMRIEYKGANQEKETTGAAILNGEMLFPDIAPASPLSGRQLRRDRVIDVNASSTGNHDAFLTRVHNKERQDRRNDYLNRSSDPSKWFYRSGGD